MPRPENVSGFRTRDTNAPMTRTQQIGLVILLVVFVAYVVLRVW
jgi:hypothetical protein